jgi:hypothetical protein
MGAGKTVKGGIELVETFLKELNKPAKGAQKVLPAAERAANLEAFLSKSQVREPLYHATPKDIKAFKPGGDDPTMSGRAIWTTTSKTNQPAQHNIGSRKAEFREGVNVMPLHGRAERPLMLDDPVMVDWAQSVFAGGSKEFPELLPDQWLKEVKDAGYDSVILADPHGRGDPHEVIFFEPTQLKSAIGNRGTYDIDDPDLNMAIGGEVHMMGGGRPPKKTTLEEDLKSFKDPAMGLADMLAGAARGTTATATGFYGDIEDLIRKYGKGLPANVIRALLPTREGKETLLPTVEEMDAMLPPVVPEGAGRSKQMADIANTLGMANPLAPAAGELGIRAVKSALPLVKDLATSRPAQAAVERLGELTGAGPMYAVKREQSTLHPRGKPLGSEKIQSLAERIAPQTQGEFVRKSKDPKETRSVEDKSLKQFKAEQSMPMVVENNTPIGSPSEFNPSGYEGNVIVGVPGDPTLGGVLSVEELGPTRGTRQLRQVGDVVLDEPVQLYGGPEYGLDNDKAFWASNLMAARGVQNLVNDLGFDRPVLGQYIKMGPGSENFAQHNLDALLSVMQPHNLSREKKDALTEMIRRGYPEGKKGQKTFESFSGFDDPNQVMLESSMDSDLRKWIAESLKMPKNMKPFEMPEGRYVATAITNPELRNLETGVSGFAVGEMRPGADLLLGPHPSYSHDIPGTLIGRTRHPLPIELAFPDTYQKTTEELVNKPKGTQHFGLFKMSGPRQLIDNQYVDEINEYLDQMKRLTGKKEGGAVMMADGGSADFFIDPSSYAEAKSKEMYPKKKSEWTERDAARHMLAAGMMAQKFGPTVAKMAGLAHEHFNAPVKTLGYALGIGKMPADYEQDLHNNALGIDLAKRAVTQEELERFIKEMTSKSSKTKTEGVPFIGEPKNAARLSDY